ncbi:MAG: molybdopterin-dependent oxidoreductase [Bacteroidales bacterium]|nr:molybdopterin-dependent oxidoreductase [Bacteroidales bacterium]
MNKEMKINERLFKDMHNPFEMDRRNFLKKVGGGLIIAFSVSDLKLLTSCSSDPEKEANMNAYLRIGDNGRVTLYTGKIEMGQGPISSLPMELADELDVNLESIDIVMGDTDLCPWDEGTYGSLSTRVFGEVLRAAGAEARAILLEMAAKKWAVSTDQLKVKEGVVSMTSHASKKVTYAELTKGKAIFETIKKKPPLKKSSEFKVIGTSRLHVDGEDKVTGAAKYSGDVQLPGMMYARIVRPPGLGAKLINLDTSEAEKIEGLEIVRDGDFIALLHKSQDVAGRAIFKVKAEYEEEKINVDDKSIFEFLKEKATENNEIDSGGNLKEGEAKSENVFESEFHDPYIAHAPIENHTATAMFEGEKLKIWASCQTPYPTKEAVAEELGIAEENVRLMTIFTGGGFGGKIYNPQAVEVARIAKLSGKPVQLVYSREEEFMYDRLRPAAVVKIRSGLNEAGEITFWDYGIHFGGSRGATHFYDIPDHRTQTLSAPRGVSVHPFYTGAWRAPSNNTNTWARESQMELMAAAAGEDALEFRLKHLEGDPKMAEVLRKGAEKFGWTSAKGSSGRGYGIACGKDAGTDVAVFVEVEVNKETGYIQVKRAVCSQYMGMVVNPQGVIIQAEGCVIMGMGYALSEEIKFSGRKMLTKNFGDYEFAHFSWTPEIDVVLIDAQDDPPQGGGEPAIICMGGAIANAVFDATGARLYQLPLTQERVRSEVRKSKN